MTYEILDSSNKFHQLTRFVYEPILEKHHLGQHSFSFYTFAEESMIVSKPKGRWPKVWLNLSGLI